MVKKNVYPSTGLSSLSRFSLLTSRTLYSVLLYWTLFYYKFCLRFHVATQFIRKKPLRINIIFRFNPSAAFKLSTKPTIFQNKQLILVSTCFLFCMFYMIFSDTLVLFRSNCYLQLFLPDVLYHYFLPSSKTYLRFQLGFVPV